jgi:uncharacterized short protein YbdD (DUF466 family)
MTSSQLLTRFVRRLRSAAPILRRLMGAPDYEAYVRHVRRSHPGMAPVGREEFCAERMEARYSRVGGRCC